MKASLQPKPMYCSRDDYYSSRFNQQYGETYTKKVNTLYTVVASPSYILPKCVKTREPKDEHWCTHISYNIHDSIPLDNLKNHTALPYIKWGLIWDSPNRRKESLRSKIFTRQASRIPKLKRGSPCR